MSKKDGGSAYPVLDSYVYEGGTWRLDCIGRGMTMRDYFAGQVLASCNSTGSPEQVALYAYMVADAMLAEREKQNALADREDQDVG
jgi:hypothetical protein